MTDLVVLQTHPIQYYAPLYRTLAQRAIIDLHVIYLSDAGVEGYEDPGFGRRIAWDIPLLDGYSHTILEPGLTVATAGFLGRASRDLTAALDALAPRCLLLYGYASRMSWQARRWASLHGVRLLYSSDSNARDRRGIVKRLVKEPVVRAFFSGIDTFLCTSEANEAYVKHFARRQSRRVRVPFAIDVERFANGAPRPGDRRQYDFIWAGKLAERKRPLDFIHALKILGKQSDIGVRALLVGDGPLREAVRTGVEKLPANVSVDCTGFANQQRMPALLQSADTLVFTSETEPYGLIATEAAAAGLALVVSERIGCVGEHDVARPGENAIVYSPGSTPVLAEAIRKLLLQTALRERFQTRSRTIARDHDLHCAAEVIERVCCAAELPSRDASRTATLTGSANGSCNRKQPERQP